MTIPQGRQPIKQRPYGKPLTRTRLPNCFASLLPPSLPRGWLRFGRRELTTSFYWFAVTDSDCQHPASKAVLWPKQIERASYTPPFHSQPSGNVTEECSRCCTLSATFPDKRDIPKKLLKRGTDERRPSGGPARRRNLRSLYVPISRAQGSSWRDHDRFHEATGPALIR